MLLRIFPLQNAPVACLKFKLVVALFAASALFVAAVPTGAQQTFTYSGSTPAINISSADPALTVKSAGISVTNPSGSTVQTISVQLSGVTTPGVIPIGGGPQVKYESMLGLAMWLGGPNGEKIVLLAATGDGADGDDAEDSGNGLSGAIITVADSASGYAPGEVNNTHWAPQNGTFTVKPASYLADDGYPAISGVTNYPYDDGGQTGFGSSAATLNGVFGNGNSAAAGTWTLYVENIDQNLPTPVTVNSWSITFTYATTSSTATTTALSSSLNPASSGNSVTFTASVTGGTTVNSGTVAFTSTPNVSGGAATTLCSAVAVSGGQAQCTASANTLGQGAATIEASYAPGSGFLASSATATELVEGTTTHSSGDTWCNTGSVSMPNVNPPQAYPSIIKVSGYPAGSTVSTVSIQLNNLSGSNGIGGQYLLVAPNGQNLDFMDSAFNGASASGINLTVEDAAGQLPVGINPASGNYEPYDGQVAGVADAFPSSPAPAIDSAIPQVPGTIIYPAPHGSASHTLASSFNNAPANGDWVLYTVGGEAQTLGGGWCVNFTVNTGVATTTTVTASQNPAAPGQSVTYTAAVTSGGSPVASGGTVTFLDNNLTPGGTVSGNNVVSLNAAGTAAFTSSALFDAVDVRTGTVDVLEGDHPISAAFSGTVDDNPSQGELVERIDNPTTLSAGSGGSINACNAGPIYSGQGSAGPFTPNPSNVFVSNIPGTINAVSLTLNNLYTSTGDVIESVESMVKGPNNVGLDFFSGTGGGLSNALTEGNYQFADSATSIVPNTSFGPGAYKPTSYLASDVFTSSASGFYNIPGTLHYSQPQGSATFANTFGGINPNGTWSLFFDMNAAQNAAGAVNGWCLNFEENTVPVSINESHNGTGVGNDFTQGENGAQLTTTITNNGPGSTGDPIGSNPLTLTDTLNASLTYTGFSGSGWSCTATAANTPPQTVTCTNDNSITQDSEYPVLTLNVNVSSSETGTFTNSVNLSGAGITSNQASDTVTVDAAPVLSITKSHSGTFTQGSTGQWTIVVSNIAANGTTSGVVTVLDTLPAGYTLNTYTSTGSLWTCLGANAITCTASPGLTAGNSSTINLTVNIPATSQPSVNNTASVYGGGDLHHTSTATASESNTDVVTVIQAPATITAVSGNNQSTAINTAFATPLTVIVKDAGGNVISGQSATFTVNAGASGQSGTIINLIPNLKTITTTTNSSGQATESITANDKAGSYTVTAQSGTGGPFVAFTLTNTGGAPASLTATGGSGQSAVINAPFAAPLTILVTDAGGNPVSGITVAFSAPGSGASANLSAPGCVTDVTGSCFVTATANGTTGSYNVAATAVGFSAGFALTNLPVPNFVVTTASDDAAGTPANCPDGGGSPMCALRDALAAAASAGAGNITFDATAFSSAETIPLGSAGTLNIPSRTTITGPTTGSGATLTNLVTVDGANASTVFYVGQNSTGVAIANLNIRNGQASSFGGAIQADSNSAVTVSNSNFTGSNAVYGGAIYAATNAKMTVSGDTFTNNSGTYGGAIEASQNAVLTVAGSSFKGNSGAYGGAIQSQGTLTVSYSTFSGNSATSSGGALDNGGTLTVANSTFSANNATGSSAPGGAINSFTGTGLTVTNSIFTGNAASSASTGNAIYFSTNNGPFAENHNLFDTSNAVSNSGSDYTLDPTDQVGGANLAALANYGGATQTMIPLPGSPAICAGLAANIPAGVTTDQRGLPNTNASYTGYDSGTACVDAGAVQTSYAITFTQQPSDVVQNAAITPAPAVTLKESGMVFTGASVTIPLTLTTGSGTLTGGSASTTSGVATYSPLSISLPGMGDVLTANLALNPAVAPAPSILAASNAFNVTNSVTQLAFSVAPAATVTAGGNAGASISVAEQDANGSTVATANDTITLTVNGPGGYAKSYTATATGGVAAFDLSVAALTAAGSYTYTASVAANPSVATAMANEAVSAATVASVAAVSGSGQSAVIGEAFATPLKVAVKDQYSNPVSGAAVNFTGPATGAGATFTAPAATAADGTTSVTATANGTASTTAYTVTASVSGGATQAGFALTNTQHSTTVTITPSTTAPVYGQPVTIAAAITPSAVLTSAPTGSVTFYDGANALTPAGTVASAASSYTVSVPAVGSHTYGAEYSGDSNFAASPMATASAVAVGKANSTLAGPATAPSFAYGTGGTISVSITGQFTGAGIAAPTGSVSYTVGGGPAQTAVISSGTATLSIPATQNAGNAVVAVNYAGDGNYNAAAPIQINLTISQATLTITANSATRVYGAANPAFTGKIAGAVNGDTFTESFATSATVMSDAGMYAITPSVTGANLANYTVSAQNGVLTVAQAGTTTTLTASAATIAPGQSLTLTAQVTDSSAGSTGTPTGTVSFYDGATLLGTGTLTSGSASYTTAALAAGVAHAITATYSGNSDFSGSSGASGVTVTVAPLDFTMIVTGPGTATVVPGGSISYQVTVTPSYGSFAGAVNFAVSGLPPGAAATFLPSSIPANSGPQTITVTIAVPPVTVAGHAPPSSNGGKIPLVLAVFLLLGLGGLRRYGRGLRRTILPAILILSGAIATLTASGCGGHGFFAQPEKTYTVTITATAGSLTHTTTVTLNVQ